MNPPGKGYTSYVPLIHKKTPLQAHKRFECPCGNFSVEWTCLLPSWKPYPDCRFAQSPNRNGGTCALGVSGSHAHFSRRGSLTRDYGASQFSLNPRVYKSANGSFRVKTDRRNRTEPFSFHHPDVLSMVLYTGTKTKVLKC